MVTKALVVGRQGLIADIVEGGRRGRRCQVRRLVGILATGRVRRRCAVLGILLFGGLARVFAARPRELEAS